MSTREGVTISRRYQLRLPPTLDSELEAFARQRGLGLGPAIRLLVGSGLSMSETSADSPAALAALIASEHAVLMVASVLPEGEQRMRSLAERAAGAAEERLALVKESGSG
jgi:hypothetical protein